MTNTPQTTFGSDIAVLSLHGLVGIDIDKSGGETGGSYNLGWDDAIAFAARLIEACGNDLPTNLRLVAAELGLQINGGIEKPPPPLPSTPGSVIEFTMGDCGTKIRGVLVEGQRWHNVLHGGPCRPEHPVRILFDASQVDESE